MMTPASLHPAAREESVTFMCGRFGTITGITPFSPWSAARSCSHFVKKLATLKLKAAVGANACASPVHPKRSSRAGVSVGTSRKFPFCPHTILRCSWFSIGFEVSNVPVGGMSEWITTPVTSSSLGVPG